MRKRRFAIVSAVYAAAMPATYVFVGTLAAIVVGAAMVASIALALLLARRHEASASAPAAPLSTHEERMYKIARRVVLVGAVASLMTWASVWAFYWELRGYFLLPGLISCIVVALAVLGVLRPRTLSGNIMRFQMMLAFGYVLAIPLIVAWVLLANALGVGVGPGVLGLVPVIASGFFIQRWRERSVAAAAG